jgi:general stress protein CsbA
MKSIFTVVRSKWLGALLFVTLLYASEFGQDYSEYRINWLTLLVLISGGVVLMIVARNRVKAKRRRVLLASLPEGKTSGRELGLSEYKERDHSFNESRFLRKVELAFRLVQNDWSEKDVTDIRGIISDGLYRQFSTQFLLMKEMKQICRRSNVEVKNLFIDSVVHDGEFDLINVGIEATVDSYFRSELTPSLNRNSSEHLLEYWSFVKKRGCTEGDLFNGVHCPACGASVRGALDESTRCKTCLTRLNSGEFDWVLVKISEGRFFAEQTLVDTRGKEVSTELCSLEDAPFAKVMIEDVVNNAFMQLVAAEFFNEPERVKHFFTDDFYESQLKKEILENHDCYHRFTINSINLVAIASEAATHSIYVALVYSARRMERSSFTPVDKGEFTHRKVIRLERKRGSGISSGQLYRDICPACGTSLNNSFTPTCSHCGEKLNNISREWIVADILTTSQYEQELREREELLNYSISAATLDSLLSIKDYAISNIIAVIACDGEIDPAEIDYLRKVARQFGYSREEESHLVTLAKQKTPAIRMPENREQREKIFALMEKAAKVDRKVVTEEKELLEKIRKEYLS